MTRLVALVLTALLSVAACGTATEKVGDPPTPTGPKKTIRDVDFSTLTWADAVSGGDLEVSPEGANPLDGPVVSLGDTLAYSDANGDGEEDALVSIRTVEGNGAETVYYIWTWDPKQEAAVQVTEPIARESRCGDVVKKVAAGEKGGFRLRERLREPLNLNTCSDDGPLEVDRTVGVVDDWPVLLSGPGGYGGVCPQQAAGDFQVERASEFELRAGPRDNLPQVTSSQVAVIRPVDTASSPWLDRDGWVLVSYGGEGGSTDGSDYAGLGDYQPCAWIKPRT